MFCEGLWLSARTKACGARNVMVSSEDPSNYVFGVGGGTVRVGEEDVAAHKHLSSSARDYLNLPTCAISDQRQCRGVGALCDGAGESSRSFRSSLIYSS